MTAARSGRRAWRRSRPTLDSFECRHGLGYTRITGKRKGVRAEVAAISCRMGTNAEIHRLTLKNDSPATRKIAEPILVRRVVPVERLWTT